MRNTLIATLILVIGSTLAFAAAGYFVAGSYQNIPALSR